jgi:CBS domain containing-hemolysin-like protein
MTGEFIAIGILLLMSAFFSAAETALTSLPRHHLQALKRKKHKGYKTIEILKDNPGRMIGTILIGNNLVNTALTALSTIVALRLATKLGIYNEFYFTPLTALTLTFVLLVFGEITPKTLAFSYNKMISLYAAPVIYVLSIVLKPFVVLFNLIATLFIRLLGGHSRLDRNSLVTEEEIISLIEAGAATGAINPEEKKMMHEIIRFGDTLVGEVMTAWDNVITVSDHYTIEQTLNYIKGHLKSRIPVYTGRRNNVIGFLYVKDLIKKLPEYTQIATQPLRKHPELIRPHVVTYIDQKTTDILKQLRFHKVHVAIVNNRDNKTVGLVTIEDLIEEIVGEISDEYEAG